MTSRRQQLEHEICIGAFPQTNFLVDKKSLALLTLKVQRVDIPPHRNQQAVGRLVLPSHMFCSAHPPGVSSPQ